MDKELQKDAEIAIGLAAAMTNRMENYTLSTWPIHSETYKEEMARAYELFGDVIARLLDALHESE